MNTFIKIEAYKPREIEYHAYQVVQNNQVVGFVDESGNPIAGPMEYGVSDPTPPAQPWMNPDPAPDAQSPG